ncbi:MAG: hypothetical protein COV45_04390 [Deltaproteobacteria bacterium CG11_big_fil_rev_8_21_14_0_20_47_16]|nr:MAG: hypothetical protein COV45_04390 [Deltaproteobacteria bacterium CG11_big_fil_rev_8_21_14_0_20_47_16]
MRVIWLIATKEWKAFFYTPFAMILLPLFLVLSGSYFASNLESYMNLAHPNESMGDVGFAVQGLNTMDGILRPFFDSLLNVFIFMVALITMRVFSEEKKSATYELLVSYPVTPGKILWGKYLGTFSIVLSMLALSLVYPIIIQMFGHPYWPQVWTIYLGDFLFLMVYVAIGVWASLLSENQLVAAVITYGAFFLSFLLGYLAHIVGTPYDRFLANFLLIAHLSSFNDGLVFWGDLAVYTAGTSFFLTLAYLRLKRHYA